MLKVQKQTVLLLEVEGALSAMSRECRHEDLMEGIKLFVGGWIEHVNPINLPKPYCMLVDEEGLLKEKQVNIVASILYNSDWVKTEVEGLGTIFEVEYPIVGDVVIAKEGYINGEMDIVSLDAEDVEKVQKILNDLIK